MRKRAPGIPLVEVERRVLEALAGGCDAKEAAEVLGISLEMVRQHVVSLCVKAFPTSLSLRAAICSKLLS